MTIDHAGAEVARLSDGRALAYAQWGAEDGWPLFHFHGLPGGRFTIWRDHSLFAGSGVRVITVDRPGVGRSDPKPGRVVADWASDVEELADQLGIDRFGVFGLSAGGPYALACAALLPSRVDAVGLVSSCGPVYERDFVKQMSTAQFFWLARRAPRALGLSFSTLSRVARRRPRAANRLFAGGAPAVDKAVLNRPEIMDLWWPAYLEAARPGGEGLTEDMRLLQSEWGFDPTDVRAPVHIWHGKSDEVAPPAHAEHWIETLADTRPVWFEGEGHFLIVDHTREIVEALAGTSTK